VKTERESKMSDNKDNLEEKLINEAGMYTVAMLDLGAHQSMVSYLAQQDCRIHLLPWDTSAEEILALSPNAVCITEGPGNPCELQETAKTLRILMDKKIPMMAVGLGHQVLALATGFVVEKLPYGHRGGQPVRNLVDNQLYITSQNHSYAVKSESIDSKIAVPYFVNVNDGTNEGICYLHTPAFSVQFTPMEHGGPKDTGYLYDQFLELVKSAK